MGWALVGVIGTFAVVILVVRARHRRVTGLLTVLDALVGQRVRLGISNDASGIGFVAPFVGVIDAVNGATQWATVQWIEADPDPDTITTAYAGNLSPEVLAENGLIAHRIRWVEEIGRSRIRLT